MTNMARTFSNDWVEIGFLSYFQNIFLNKLERMYTSIGERGRGRGEREFTTSVQNLFQMTIASKIWTSKRISTSHSEDKNKMRLVVVSLFFIPCLLGTMVTRLPASNLIQGCKGTHFLLRRRDLTFLNRWISVFSGALIRFHTLQMDFGIWLFPFPSS